MPNKKMKTAVIYARYSSDNQTEQSIEGQIRVCGEYAQRNNILILATYIDRAMTGTNDNRPDFKRMMKDSEKREWDYILVYKLDRFSRNKYETAIHKKTLKDNGVRVVSAMENIPDTPEGIILESLLEGMNQYYSAELSQKIKRGMRETRLKGYFQGGCLPYGYKLDGRKIVVDEDQAEIVRYIYGEYSKGVIVRNIIADLNAKGITHHNKPFSKDSVYNILRNEKYAGIYRYGEDLLGDMYPQIVPTPLFEEVRAIVAKNKHGKRSVDYVYLLRGKLICGYCGKAICAESSVGHKGKRKFYYKCSGRKSKTNGCTKSIVRKDLLEKLVLDTIVDRLKEPHIMNEFVRKILALQEKQNKNNSKLQAFLKEQRQNQSALNNIMAAVEQGLINNTTNRRMKELEERQEELERVILIEKNKQISVLTEKQIRDYYEQALRLEAQMLINFLIQKIVLYDNKIEIYFHYPAASPDDDRGLLFCVLLFTPPKK